MRTVNFSMGSILPENNSYKLSSLDQGTSTLLGLAKNANNFRPQANRPPILSN